MSGHSIELEHIIKSYSGKPVIRDVSLALPANTTTAIVGESGSGKSTLLQLINGLVLPDSGSVRVQGELLDYSRLPGIRRTMRRIMGTQYLILRIMGTQYLILRKRGQIYSP